MKKTPQFYKAKFFYIVILLFFSSITRGNEADTVKKNQLFELSFGQSLLFISDSKVANLRNREAVIIPTNAILFFAEFFPQKKIRIPVFFNLPTETKQFLINNLLVNERANPSFGFGIEYNFFQIKLDSKSKLEFEIGPLATFVLDKNNTIRVLPILAGRLRIMRGEDFVMYIGTSYSVGINSWGLLYGTGTVF